MSRVTIVPESNASSQLLEHEKVEAANLGEGVIFLTGPPKRRAVAFKEVAVT